MTQGEVFPDQKNIFLTIVFNIVIFFSLPFQKSVPLNLWRHLEEIVTIQVKGMQ